MSMIGGVAPRIGDVVRLDRQAGVQFTRPVWFRVIGVRPATEVAGWLYLDGWEIADDGELSYTTVFARVAGLVIRRDEDVASGGATAGAG